MKFIKLAIIFFPICIFKYSALCQEADLPLTIKDAPVNSNPMVFYISGDGGWNSYDKKLANEYKTNKMPYIALNSLHYFWSRKTPEQLAKDIVPVLYKYLKEWNKKEIIMIGYSFGADVMPFLINRLPNDLKQKVKLISLISPSQTSDFTIHLNDMLLFNGKYGYDVVYEIYKISSPQIFCFFGTNDGSIFPKSHQQKNLKIFFVNCGHVFTDSKAVMDPILEELK